jgi:hypothetical protein
MSRMGTISMERKVICLSCQFPDDDGGEAPSER